MQPRLLFDEHSLGFVLEAFDVTVDVDGYLVKDGKRIKDYVHNESILREDLVGIHKVGFFRNDMESIIKLSEL
jgi:hypothetical protein